MDCTLWKTILLEWTNQTGFFNRSYDDLGDTDINVFFSNFKKKLSYEHGDSVSAFIADKYPGFQLKSVESSDVVASQCIDKDDYIFVYSLLLHYSCVRYAEPQLQQICSVLPGKFQSVVAKYFSSLLKETNYTRVSIQAAIEDAEVSGAAICNSSPLNRNHIQTTLSPPTPRTKLLDHFNMDNRNLKAQLEAERMDRHFQEVELSNYKDKISVLEEKYRDAQNQVKQLKRELQVMEDDKAPPKLTATEQTAKRLQKELLDKENKLMDLEGLNSSLIDKIILCEQQITFLSTEMKTFIYQNGKMEEQIKLLEAEVEDRTKMNEHLSQNNRELDEIIRDLRSQLDMSGFNSSSDMLNGSVSEHRQNGNVSFICPENLANAVVDVRLVDQQKENQNLIEKLERIHGEFITIRNENIDMLAKMAESQGKQISTVGDIDDISVELRHMVLAFVEQNRWQAEKILADETQIEQLIESKHVLKNQVDENMVSNKRLRAQVATLKEQLAASISERQQLQNKMDSVLDSLHTERDEREKTVASIMEQLSELNDQLDKAKQEINNRTIDLSRYEEVVKKLQSDLDESTNKVDSLEAAKKLMETQIDQAIKESEATDHTIDALRKDNERVKSELRDVEGRVRVLHADRDQISEQWMALKAEHTSLVTEKNELAAKFEAEKLQWQAKFNTLDESLTANKQLLCSNDMEIGTLRSAIQERQEKLNTIEKDRDVVSQKLEESEASKRSLEHRIVSLQENMEAMSGAKQALQANFESIEENLFDLRQEHQSLLKTHEEVSHELLQVRSECDNIAPQLNELRMAYATRGEELEQLRALRNQLEANIGSIEKREKQLLSELANALQNETKLKFELAASEKNCTDLAQKIKSLETSLLTAKEDLQAKVEQNKVLNEGNAQHQLALNNLRAELENLKSQLEYQTESHDNQQKESDAVIESLRSDIQRTTGKYSSLKEEFDAVNHEMAEEKRNLESELHANGTLLEEIAQLKEKITTIESDADQQMKNFEEKVAKALSDLVAAESKNSQLHEKLTTMTAEQAAKEQQITASTAEINRLQEKLAKIEADDALHKKTSEEKMAKALSDLVAAESKNSQLHEKLTTMTAEQAAKEQQITASTAEINRLQEKLTKIEADDALHKKTSEEKMAKVLSDLVTAESKNSQLHEKLTTMTAEQATKEQQITDSTAEIDRLQEMLAKIESDADLQKKTSEENMAKVLSDLRAAELKNTELDCHLTALSEEKSTNEQTIAEKTKQIDQLRDAMAQSKTDLETAMLAINRQQEEIYQLQQQKNELIADTEKKVNEQNHFNTETEARHQELIQKYTDLEQQLYEQRQLSMEEQSNSKNRIHEQEAQIKAITRNMEEITETLKSVRHEYNEFKMEMGVKAEEASNNQQQLTAMQEGKLQLEADVASLQITKEQLTSELQKLIKECDDQRAQVELCQLKLDELAQKYNHDTAHFQSEKGQLEAAISLLKAEIETADEAQLIKEQKYLSQLEQTGEKMSSLEKENVSLKEELKKMRSELLQGREEVERTKNELATKALISKSCRSKSDNDLIASLNAKIDSITQGREQDVSVLRAKLTKTREQLDEQKKVTQEAINKSQNADDEIRENRQQNEEKLEKMKEKMKTLYNDEMAKIKTKHEKDSAEFKSEIERSRTCIKKLSNELYVLNEKQLDLQKDNEFMKTRLRLLESNPHQNHGRPSLPMATKLMGKIPGVNFKMEDEEGELFNNTYLDDLKSGGRFLPGCDSITHDELARRNSMYPLHLRSSYAPQYADQNLNEDDLLKPRFGKSTMDDSMLSVQSDGRRGTLYKRPGPPTPSKNGGRLSIGGELPKGEILREFNNQNDIGGVAKVTPSGKKNTPGTSKRRSLFSTAKMTEYRNKLLL